MVLQIIMFSSCNTCDKRLLRHARQLNCSSCGKSVHLRCIPNVSPTESLYLDRHNNKWICLSCSEIIFPFNHYKDDFDFQNTLLEFFTQVNRALAMHLPNLEFNPFDLNDDIPNIFGSLYDSDPDLQFYNDSTCLDNVSHCDYYLEDSFLKRINELAIDDQFFSVFHMNIRSIPKN